MFIFWSNAFYYALCFLPRVTSADSDAFEGCQNKLGELLAEMDCNRNGYSPRGMVLTSELVQFFGVQEPERIENVLRALNGLFCFLENDRRVSVEMFFNGAVAAMESIKRNQMILAELQSERERHALCIQKCEGLGTEIKELFVLNDKVNDAKNKLTETKKALEEENKRISAELEATKSELTKAEADLKIERSKVTRMKNETQKLDVPRKSIPLDVEGLPSLNKYEEILRAEIIRLQNATKALAATADVPVQDVDSTVKSKRISTEEAAKLRKTVFEQSIKLDAFGAQVIELNSKCTDAIKENDAIWNIKVMALRQQVDELKSELMTLQNDNQLLRELQNPTSSQPKELANTLMEMLSREPRRQQVSNGIFLTRFTVRGNLLMQCPIPLRSGALIPLKDVYTQWKAIPCENAGTYFSTVQCPETNQVTMICAIEQVLMIHDIASDLQLNLALPLRFQYFDNGTWVNFYLQDQIAIASTCCRLYRLGVTNAEESMMVRHKVCNLFIHILDSKVDFQITSVNNSDDINSVCLVSDGFEFFERWTFTIGDESDMSV